MQTEEGNLANVYEEVIEISAIYLLVHCANLLGKGNGKEEIAMLYEVGMDVKPLVRYMGLRMVRALAVALINEDLRVHQMLFVYLAAMENQAY